MPKGKNFTLLHCYDISGSVSTLVYQSGDTALLPCDVSVPRTSSDRDELTLVMWYREDVKSPIYSIDARTSEFLPVAVVAAAAVVIIIVVLVFVKKNSC